MDSVLKVATPARRRGSCAREGAAAAGAGDVTSDVSVVTTLPYWSSILAMMEASVLPAVVLTGCCVMTSCEAAAGEMVKLSEVAAVSCRR